MKTIKVGDFVLPPGDPPLTGARPWRVLDLYEGKARIEFIGEAWTRFKTVPAAELRLVDPSKRPTARRA